MIKKLSLITLLFLLLSCSNLQFVYDNQKENFLFLKTSIVAFGDDNVLIKRNLEEIIKKPNGTSEYVLTVNSKKNSSNLVIEDNQAATQIENSFTINYKLTDPGGVCLFDQHQITTTLDYRVKSSGYNFGSDLSKKNINKKNINKNINSYLSHLLKTTNGIKCVNDNKS